MKIHIAISPGFSIMAAANGRNYVGDMSYAQSSLLPPLKKEIKNLNYLLWILGLVTPFTSHKSSQLALLKHPIIPSSICDIY